LACPKAFELRVAPSSSARAVAVFILLSPSNLGSWDFIA
jgi:hypothetical protein